MDLLNDMECTLYSALNGEMSGTSVELRLDLTQSSASLDVCHTFSRIFTLRATCVSLVYPFYCGPRKRHNSCHSRYSVFFCFWTQTIILLPNGVKSYSYSLAATAALSKLHYLFNYYVTHNHYGESLSTKSKKEVILCAAVSNFLGLEFAVFFRMEDTPIYNESLYFKDKGFLKRSYFSLNLMEKKTENNTLKITLYCSKHNRVQNIKIKQ